jgi:hypothetical protein
VLSACSAANRWRFLVVRDPKIKERVGAYYKRAWDEQVAPRYRAGGPAPGMSRERFLRLLDAAGYLADTSMRLPSGLSLAWKAMRLPERRARRSIQRFRTCCSLYERSASGRLLTTLYLQFEKEAEAALGLPPGVHSYALLPIGYPMGRFGPVRRIAIADVVYEERWGEPYRNL